MCGLWKGPSASGIIGRVHFFAAFTLLGIEFGLSHHTQYLAIFTKLPIISLLCCSTWQSSRHRGFGGKTNSLCGKSISSRDDDTTRTRRTNCSNVVMQHYQVFFSIPNEPACAILQGSYDCSPIWIHYVAFLPQYSKWHSFHLLNPLNNIIFFRNRRDCEANDLNYRFNFFPLYQEHDNTTNTVHYRHTNPSSCVK